MASTLRGTLPASAGLKAATFILWALAAWSVVYWSLKLWGTSAEPAVAASTPLRSAAVVDTAAVGRVLGTGGNAAQSAAAPALSSRFALLGVVANGVGGGAALISVDGSPAKPFRVGALVDEGLVLQSVQGRRALLGAQQQGATTLTLELPPRPGQS